MKKGLLSVVAGIGMLSFVGCGGGENDEAGDKSPPSSDVELALVGHWAYVDQAGNAFAFFLNADGTATQQTPGSTNQSDNWSVVDGLFYFTSDVGMEYNLNGDTFSVLMGQTWTDYTRQ